MQSRAAAWDGGETQDASMDVDEARRDAVALHVNVTKHAFWGYPYSTLRSALIPYRC